MTTRTKRLSNMSIGRVSADGDEVVNTPLGEIYGKANNFAGGELVDINNEGWGPIGPDNYPSETHSISDFTFDLLEASQQPETLGPVDIFLNVYRSWRNDDGTLQTNVRQYAGRFENKGNGTWDRTTESGRAQVFKPFRLIHGGGAGLDELSKGDCGLYIDTHTGEYLTRLNGIGPQVDHFAAMRAAHGV